MTNLVLAIEDEVHARRLLRVVFEHAGYRVLEAATGRAGIDVARSEKPSVILLDLGLPDGDGREIARRLRRLTAAPIIVVSGRSREDEKVALLDDGADDYITKPFTPKELLARVRVALRRAGNGSLETSEPMGQFDVGELHVDFELRRVVANGREVRLTPTEYKLLSVLIDCGGRVATHGHLLERVWGFSGSDHINYLRVYMRQLRHKLEPDPESPRYLVTEPSVGYRLRVARAPGASSRRSTAAHPGSADHHPVMRALAARPR